MIVIPIVMLVLTVAAAATGNYGDAAGLGAIGIVLSTLAGVSIGTSAERRLSGKGREDWGITRD